MTAALARTPTTWHPADLDLYARHYPTEETR